MTKTVALIGSLDTKGPDIQFIQERIAGHGYETLILDTGVIGSPLIPPDISAGKIAEAGGSTLEDLRKKGDRGHAMLVMQAGAVRVVRSLFEKGEFHGILGVGGGTGTSIATAAMRTLPLGFPKVMLSTLASGSTEQYLQEKDILMVPSIVDISGVNRISAGVYSRAVGVLAGLLETDTRDREGGTATFKPLLAASMFGNTTPVVERCKMLIQEKGNFEVIIFHATGTGGKCMESLIRENHIEGVLDITTTELADELTGGVMSAGPERLTAAGEKGIPQIIVPGCVDMVNFWGEESIPGRYKNRRFYRWNPDVTLMRTNPEENEQIGKTLAERANRAAGPAAIILPLLGVSMLDSPGREFWWEEADHALFKSIKQNTRGNVEIIEKENNINDDSFADTIVETFFTISRK